MTVFESAVFSKWLPFILIPVLIITILGLSFWYFTRRQRNIQNSNKKKPVHSTLLPKTEHLPSPSHSITTKSLSTSTSKLTNTDKTYLDTLVRTASDRSMWKRDHSKTSQHNKLRKVPSGQIQEKP